MLFSEIDWNFIAAARSNTMCVKQGNSVVIPPFFIARLV
jgi:hypothetical protein